MKFRIAAMTALWMATTTMAMAFDAVGMAPPVLVHGQEKASGIGCQAVRAKKPSELPKQWRHAIIKISMTCAPMPGVNNEPDASTETVARLRPGAATLQGIPVVELRHSASWAHADSQYVLDATYPEVAGSLGAYIRARCLAAHTARKALATDLCTIAPDAAYGGIFVKTNEMGGTWLHADPSDPRRTVLADAISE